MKNRGTFHLQPPCYWPTLNRGACYEPAERELEQRRLRARALQVLDSVLEAGGRLDFGTDISKREIERDHRARRGTRVPDAAAALGWANWVRQHTKRTNPLNGPLHVLEVASYGHDELQPHMNGWSTYGPYRY